MTKRRDGMPATTCIDGTGHHFLLGATQVGVRMHETPGVCLKCGAERAFPSATAAAQNPWTKRRLRAS